MLIASPTGVPSVRPSPLTLSSSFPVPALGPLVPFLPSDAEEPAAAGTLRDQRTLPPVSTVPCSLSRTAASYAAASGALVSSAALKPATSARPRSRGSSHNELRAAAPEEYAPLLDACALQQAAGDPMRATPTPSQPQRLQPVSMPVPAPGESLVWSGAQQAHSLRRGAHQQHQQHLRPFLTPVHEVQAAAAGKSAFLVPPQATERSASATEAMAGGNESPASPFFHSARKRELRAAPTPATTSAPLPASYSATLPLTPSAYAMGATEREPETTRASAHQPIMSLFERSGRETGDLFASSASSIRGLLTKAFLFKLLSLYFTSAQNIVRVQLVYGLLMRSDSYIAF